MTSSKRSTGKPMHRREFMWLMGCVGVAPLAGCVTTDPVTGKRGVVLLSEQQEIAIDKQQSPHQFSSDYGVSQDSSLNQYLNSVGTRIAQISHRPQMPYTFQVVNATYVNAYAFPGGSIAATRGILLEMDNEAELAALIGHEVAHVNARHSAEGATRSQLASFVAGAAAMATSRSANYKQYADVVNTLGGMGAGALLARYSRGNEREADDLGVQYMVKAGQNPQGMVGLMEMLNSTSQREPSLIEQMFSSHPMSSDRYRTAVDQVSKYNAEKRLPLNKERYMDYTAGLRRIRSSIENIQAGEKELGSNNFSAAESYFDTALRSAPNDYCGLVMSAKCQLTQNKYQQASRLLERAKSTYPQEAQAVHLNGVANLKQGKHQSAYNEFRQYEQKMPGNPNSIFFQGISLEQMNEKKRAADDYTRYLKQVTQGDQAKYAYTRLTEWGYIKPKN